jgi:hypothetical protein
MTQKSSFSSHKRNCQCWPCKHKLGKIILRKEKFMLNKIVLPSSFNYVGVFLCLRCNLNCSYCINRFGETKKYQELSGEDWIKGLSRIETRSDLPLSIQGGEPLLHSEFYDIVTSLYYGYNKQQDLLTNGLFNAYEFQMRIPGFVFMRAAPYASIRFSFHKNTNMIALAMKVDYLNKLGYSVGIWGLKHPDMVERNEEMADLCKWLSIDYREKEFLDENYQGYKYPEAVNGKRHEKIVMCKPSELLIAPNGDIFQCHSDLYAGIGAEGNILDKDLIISDKFRECSRFGFCNPCDVKIKNNRFQEGGHTSVEIKEVE